MPYGGQIDIRLYGLSGSGPNFDLFVYKGDCDSNTCYAYSTNTGDTDEFLSLWLGIGDYYIIADPKDGGTGTFNLSVSGCYDAVCKDANYLKCGRYDRASTRGWINKFNATDYGCDDITGDYDGPDRVYLTAITGDI